MKKLYLTAFPKWERFPIWQLKLMALHKNVHFQAIYDHEQFVGLTYYAVGQAGIYLTYLAVNPDLRGQGYGTQILTQLQTKFPDKRLTLDIEPVVKSASNYQQRVRRLHFYQKNGFNLTNYRLIDNDGQFQILTTAKYFNRVAFITLLKQMSFGCYQFKVE